MTDEIEIHGVKCKVASSKTGKTWKVTGSYKGQPVIARATTEKKAFENWKKRAEMMGDSISS